MGNFLAGLVTIERDPRVLCANLIDHSSTIQRLRLKPETYREWEGLKMPASLGGYIYVDAATTIPGRIQEHWAGKILRYQEPRP